MDLTAIIIVPTIFYFLYKFFESLIRRRERIELVQKLDLANLQALPAEDSLSVLNNMPNKRFSGLRTGLLFIGIGIGLTTAWVLMFTLYPQIVSYRENLGGDFYSFKNLFNIIYLAAPAVFGGIGLMISYIIEQKSRK